MALRDPVEVYNARSNEEAHLLRNALFNFGIEAFVSEVVPGRLGKIQVWIDRSDIERVQPILEDHKRRSAQRQNPHLADPVQAGPPIEVACEACGQRTAFSSLQRGSVQDCPHCGAYVDVVADKASENGHD